MSDKVINLGFVPNQADEKEKQHKTAALDIEAGAKDDPEVQGAESEAKDAAADGSEDRSYLVGYTVSLLLKGPIYRSGGQRAFSILMKVERDVRAYVKQIGLQLEVDDAEGYAYLRSMTENEFPDDMVHRPQKLSRVARLSFFTSFLLVMLRKRLIEFDAGQDGTRLVLTGAEIIDYVKTFIKDGANSARVDDKLAASIKQAVSFGFLRDLDSSSQKEVRQGRYEVRRIIKAFFDAKRIASLDDMLGQYLNKLNQQLKSSKPDEE